MDGVMGRVLSRPAPTIPGGGGSPSGTVTGGGPEEDRTAGGTPWRPYRGAGKAFLDTRGCLERERVGEGGRDHRLSRPRDLPRRSRDGAGLHKPIQLFRRTFLRALPEDPRHRRRL